MSNQSKILNDKVFQENDFNLSMSVELLLKLLLSHVNLAQFQPQNQVKKIYLIEYVCQKYCIYYIHSLKATHINFVDSKLIYGYFHICFKSVI